MLNSVSRSRSDVGRRPVPVGRLQPAALQRAGDDAHARLEPHYPTPISPNRCSQLASHECRRARVGLRPDRRARRPLRGAPPPSAAWSRTRSPTRSVGRPDWRVPKKSPGPRSSRSRSAITKPSVVSVIAFSRSRPCVGQRRLIQQDAVRLVRAAADAAAQLVQLRQAEALGVLDHHHRRVRHVDADLDDRRRDEDVELAARRTPPITRSFASCFIRPCSSATRYAGKTSCAQVVGHLGRRLADRPSPTPRPADR